jgi:uncharacterized membrane protein
MADTTKRQLTFTEEELEQGRTMAALAYVFFVIPLIAAREQRYAMFHTEQAIVIWIGWIVLRIGFSIFSGIFYSALNIHICGFWVFDSLIWLVLVVFWIMGLIAALQKKTEPLPLIGDIAAKFNLVK